MKKRIFAILCGAFLVSCDLYTPCSDCAGSGKIEGRDKNYYECETCEGTGKIAVNPNKQKPQD